MLFTIVAYQRRKNKWISILSVDIMEKELYVIRTECVKGAPNETQNKTHHRIHRCYDSARDIYYRGDADIRAGACE